MARLFISYAREDRRFVEGLDTALARDGHKVWWDRELATAAGAFRPQILEALDGADLVLVAWTARSRFSRFVADEADIALSQGKLLSLLVDKARPALGFGAIHGVDLSRWDGTDDDEGLQELRREIARRLVAGPQPAAHKPAARVLGAAAGLCAATAAAFGTAQAGLSEAGSPVEAVRLGLEYAAYALALSVPVAAFAASRSRRLGMTRWRAVARPYLRTLLVGFLLALVFGAVAMAAGAGEELARSARLRQLASVVLFGALVVAACVGAGRLMLSIDRR